MIEKEKIKQVAMRIAKAINAEQVILFGSYARNQVKENSDVDLLIIAESNLPRFKRSRKLYKLFNPYPFAMDLIVYTPSEINKWRKNPISFIFNILKEGEVLYTRKDLCF